MPQLGDMKNKVELAAPQLQGLAKSLKELQRNDMDNIYEYEVMAERMEQLEAELNKLKWKPINTAPKDGTKILLMDKYGDVLSAWWYVCPKDGQGNWKNLTHEDMDIDWKRWMPIPPID